MGILFLSLVGFCALGTIDFAILDRFTTVRKIVLLLGVASLMLAFVVAYGQGQPLGLPAWLKYPGWVLTILGGSLLIYSVFIEIPLTLRQRQLRMTGYPAPTLVQTGTYALCRHPGFWWLIFLLAGQIMAVQNSGVAQLALVWIVLDLTLVTLQDRYLFPRRFLDYGDYQARTPFLVPIFNQDTLNRIFNTDYPT
jgi:protein-S-isoprenylcysteine O-methyltransferase Ste14